MDDFNERIQDVYSDRLTNVDALFGTGSPRPADKPEPAKVDIGRALALAAANEVFRDQFLPHLRAWLAVAVESAKQSRLTSDAFARFAGLMGDAGKPVSNAAMFSGWEDAVAEVCRAVVKSELLARTDIVFDGFNF